MDTEILNVEDAVSYEDIITKTEIHSYLPYLSGPYPLSSEIRIAVQNQDIYTVPCNSFLQFRGTLLKDDGDIPTTTKIVRNGILHMISKISYELNGIELDQTRDVGITCTLKNYLSLTHNQLPAAKMAGWGIEPDYKLSLYAGGRFEICIPLAMVLGYAEDYKHIIIIAKQELVILLANTQVNALLDTSNQPENVTLSIHTIEWLLPHVQVNTAERIRLLKFVEKGTNIDVAFRSWSLETYPNLTQSQNINWNVKSSFAAEKPRYIIVAFQTNKQNDIRADRSTFNHAKIKNIKVLLNSESYPYLDMNADFENGRYLLAYQMYAQYQQSYYGQLSSPILGPSEFKNIAPLFVFDVSRQDDRINTGVIDCKIEITAAENMPANTQAYALIIHDRLATYNVRDKVVKILV
ncbi:uncharacterized protein LOC134531492 [Bacillus rossius redtenbacheri]|uniref:uncharacterized protein LOC134531492 n=1 Tax=Bacillus rossius redtenbacheri TaxID=93214 RepID=UPI002FDE68DC